MRDEEQLIDRVRALARGEFAARAARADRDGAFPFENLAELGALGIPGLALDEGHGGLVLSPAAQVRVIEEIARSDASTAVVLNMHRIAVDVLAALPPSPYRDGVLDDVGRNGALLCYPASIPTGGLDNRASGYAAVDRGDELVVYGSAGFASGSDGASYVLITAVIPGGEEGDAAPRQGSLAIATPRIDAPGVRVCQTWDAMGLRATASNDILCDGLVIPREEAFVIPLALARALTRAVEAQGGLAFQRRSLGTLGVLAIWLGLARAAFDFTLDYVSRRHGHLAGEADIGGPAPGYRSGQPWAQSAIGAMDHWLATGRIVLDDMVRRVDQPAASGPAFARHLLRAVYHLRRMTEEVALGAVRVCGAHAYVRARPLERIVRDMLGGVAMAWKTDQLVETLGRAALGLSLYPGGPAGT